MAIDIAIQALKDRAGPADPPPPDPEQMKAVDAQEQFDQEIKHTLMNCTLGKVPELPADASKDRARIVKFLAASEDEDLPQVLRETVTDYLQDLIRRQAGLPIRKRH